MASTSRGTTEKSKSKGKEVHVEDVAGVPEDVKKLRACMICSLIKTYAQFEQEGCDNCDETLNLAGRSGSAYSYTSSSFEGMIALIDPTTSWAANWQHIVTMKKGVYAVSVRGELSPSLKIELLESGFRYRCRDRGLTAEELVQREQYEDTDDVERERKLKKSRKRNRNKKNRKGRASGASKSSEAGKPQERNKRKQELETRQDESGPDWEEEEANKSDDSVHSDVAESTADQEFDTNLAMGAAGVNIKDEVMSQIG